MAFHSARAKLVLPADVERQLNRLAHSRTEPAQRVARAQILLAYAAGEPIHDEVPVHAALVVARARFQQRHVREQREARGQEASRAIDAIL